jgi:putative ATPase
MFETQPLAPLAERMRPRSLEDYVGQTQLVGPGAPLRRMLEGGHLSSILLWGPPGVGKTTLALLMARQLNRPFKQLSAVQSGVKDVREAMDFAKGHLGTILFIDEIHRFNKSQQDALLQAVERGLITLIGATTENPSFEVISALLSRCQVYVLQPLAAADLDHLLHEALAKDEWLRGYDITLTETGALHRLSGGDGRKLLNLLELVVQQSPVNLPLVITDEVVQETARQKVALYDKKGEMHYDTISAFIKSIRGGDPNAALYYLARMLEGGEDVEFIARRLIISASEDIGNANPNALLLATSTFDAVERIGLPEGRIVLAQCVTYLATSPKSNASYMGIKNAEQLVHTFPDAPIPLHLRNAPTKLMKGLGYGAEYKYSHDFEEANHQEFMPTGLEGRTLYEPKPIGREREIAEFLKARWGDKYKPTGAV